MKDSSTIISFISLSHCNMNPSTHFGHKITVHSV